MARQSSFQGPRLNSGFSLQGPKRACCTWVLWTAVILGLGGCSSSHPASVHLRQEVHVAAASNLKHVLDALVADFHKTHSDVQVKVTYGSSGNFMAQLINHAPYDLFLSADADYPTRLERLGLVAPEDQFTYAIGQLVLWVSQDSLLDPTSQGLSSLADPRVTRIAIANPRHAPYGRAAEAALSKLGYWEPLQQKLVLGENVEQTAHFLHTGAAQAGLLPYSLVLGSSLKDTGRHWLVPRDLYPPLTQNGVILTWAKGKAAAYQLRNYLRGEAGRRLFQRYGYLLPKE